MNITLDYRNPTHAHCDVAVYVNGALTGVLKLRQDELDSFQFIVANGMNLPGDVFLSTGDPGPYRNEKVLDQRLFYCTKCGGDMKPGTALHNTLVGFPDFPGGEVSTVSRGGPGRLVPCMKCVKCGWSVTVLDDLDELDLQDLKP